MCGGVLLLFLSPLLYSFLPRVFHESLPLVLPVTFKDVSIPELSLLSPAWISLASGILGWAGRKSVMEALAASTP